ncbi:MAG TPA: SpoIID/LytB domain-containing protein, partial [Pyrinomonadaceae bacterium]
MQNSIRTIAILLLIASVLLSPLTFPASIGAQERQSRAPAGTGEKKTWPADQGSIVRKASESKEQGQLQNEPVMRIALSTDTRAATISTTAKLLNASEFNPSALPLETTRVRVESRMLSPSAPVKDPAYDLEIARALSHDEAERMIESVRQITGHNARSLADSTDTWKVVVSSESLEDANTVSAKLEDAGFEVLSLREAGSDRTVAAGTGKAPALPAKAPNGASSNKLRLTSRAVAPGRELIAFANGAAPLLHSSAPLTFASSDEANAPVRLNDKPFRGKIEVFANTRGALTVVNVIGLEDYVRGVVPNELSPGGYPAIEAQKAQAIAARTYALKNQGHFASEGYDLLPTTRSQVYRGLTSENPLSS